MKLVLLVWILLTALLINGCANPRESINQMEATPGKLIRLDTTEAETTQMPIKDPPKIETTIETAETAKPIPAIVAPETTCKHLESELRYAKCEYCQEKSSYNETIHQRLDLYEKVCTNCHAVLATRYDPDGWKTEPHEWNGNACTKCPYAKPETTTLVETTQAIPETIAIETTQAPPKETSMVWVTDSGKKYHADSSCSNMKAPKEISLEDAVKSGREPCKRCYK